MDRKEALADFKEKAATAVERAMIQFHKDFTKNREVYCEKLLEGFDRMAEKLKKEYKDTEIAELQFSYLQAHVIDGTYQWAIEARDKDKILDKKEKILYIAMPELFDAFEQLEDALKSEAAKYIGNLYEGDIADIKIEAFEKCKGYFYLGGYHAFRAIRKRRTYKEFKKHRAFLILIGGYMDEVQMVHLQTNEDFEAIKEEMYKKGDMDHLKEHNLLYRDYSGIVLKEESKRVDCKNLMFTCFEDCRIRYHLFTLTNLMGANFRNSRIDDTAFIGNTFQQADFTGAVLCNCDMHTSMFYGGEYVNGQITPGIYPVSFRECVLDNVNFSYCDLRNCDFENADMRKAVFDSAKLKGARMNMKYRDKLNLSQEQKEEIVWIV